MRLPGALLPGLGMGAIVVVAQFPAMLDATAELIVPLTVAGALGGIALGAGRRDRRPSAWAVGAAGAVFAFYAAPIVLSGEATFAGYIKLDDTATWLALTDRVMEHGRSLEGLAPSTYEAALDFNLAEGYPIGAFLPLGAGAAITGTDPRGSSSPTWPPGRRCSPSRSGSWRGRWSTLPDAGGDRLRRRPARAALRLLPLGRDQGGRGGGDPRHRGGAVAGRGEGDGRPNRGAAGRGVRVPGGSSERRGAVWLVAPLAIAAVVAGRARGVIDAAGRVAWSRGWPPSCAFRSSPPAGSCRPRPRRSPPRAPWGTWPARSIRCSWRASGRPGTSGSSLRIFSPRISSLPWL